MNWLRQAFIDVRVRVRSVFGRRAMRARMDEEMRLHVEMREARLVAAGSTPAEARRQARREFGNMSALRDSAADMWKYGTVERLLQDVRYGTRTLRRTPGFTAIAISVLALGIGVNATVFSVANAYFLRSLPVADASRVVRVYSNRFSNSRQQTYAALRDGNSTLAGLAAFQMVSVGVRIDRETEHTFGQIVSGNYFSLLGVNPSRGRVLGAVDDRADAPPVAVLSHAFWERRFAAAPDVIGRTLALNDRAFTIVGVLEPGFAGAMAPLRADFWVPLSADALLRPALDPAARADSLSVHMLGRLKPGTSRIQAQSELDTIGRRLRTAAGQTDTDTAVSVYPAVMLHPEIAVPAAAFVGVLMAVVGLVLLIVCVNVANLVLARAASRGTELAIRQSIGAGRGRLIRQLLTENLLLSLAGAAGGLAIAYWLTHALMLAVGEMPSPFPVSLDVPIDLRVLAYIMLVVVGSTLTFGTVPAIGASNIDLVRVLKGVGGQDRGHGRARTGFLIVQVSLSVLLLVTAGLFILALRSAQTIDTGFDGSHVLTASLDLEARGYPADRGRDFLRTLTERLEAAPGVISANVLDILPLTLSNRAQYYLRDGDAVSPVIERPPMPIVYMNGVGPGHFKTLQISLIEGRDFTPRDTEGAARVAIVNETLARRFWPGQRASGQRLHPVNDPRETFEVVGVVKDSKYVAVGEETRPFLYQPFAQAYGPQATVLVRAAGTPGSVLPALTQVVRVLDAGLPVFNVATMDEATSISLLPAKVAGRLLATLGGLALALSALGTYGVLSFLVRSRAREIAIRLAIGASPRDVAVMVVRQSLAWTGAGTVIGLTLALVLTRFLAAFLYGVNPSDPWTFSGVAVLIAVVACAAAFVPARRASRQDPLVTLRDA
jgi:predicted permease